MLPLWITKDFQTVGWDALTRIWGGWLPAHEGSDSWNCPVVSRSYGGSREKLLLFPGISLPSLSALFRTSFALLPRLLSFAAIRNSFFSLPTWVFQPPVLHWACGGVSLKYWDATRFSTALRWGGHFCTTQTVLHSHLLNPLNIYSWHGLRLWRVLTSTDGYSWNRISFSGALYMTDGQERHGADMYSLTNTSSWKWLSTRPAWCFWPW